MTFPSAKEREHQRLASIASEYERDGYSVMLQPATSDLPDFLAAFRPDLLAVGKGEKVVVQVRTRDQLGDGQFSRSFENAVRDRPGWRYELIIDRLTYDEEQQPISATQIRALLDEANRLRKHGYAAAALLVLWSAIEAALRLIAIRENVELGFPSAAFMLNSLYTLGLLSREQYFVLHDNLRLRQRAAHGFQASIELHDTEKIEAVLSELLEEVDIKAA